jgi:preprotein translocase subunit SecG
MINAIFIPLIKKTMDVLVKYLAIFGLCLQFVAFWLAAPELLGVEALKRFEKGLVKLLANLPGMTLGIVGFATGIGLGVYGIMVGLKGDSDAAKRAIIWIAIVFTLYVVFVVVFYKRLQKVLRIRVAEPLMNSLIQNNKTRKIALAVGAAFFTLGFICQFVSLVLS